MKSFVHTGERISRLVEKFHYAAWSTSRSLIMQTVARNSAGTNIVSRQRDAVARVPLSTAGSLKVRRCDRESQSGRVSCGGREIASRHGVASTCARVFRSLSLPFCLFRVIRIARRNRGSALTSAIKLVATRNVRRFNVFRAHVCVYLCVSVSV